jgi:hypothetical protein
MDVRMAPTALRIVSYYFTLGSANQDEGLLDEKRLHRHTRDGQQYIPIKFKRIEPRRHNGCGLVGVENIELVDTIWAT